MSEAEEVALALPEAAYLLARLFSFGAVDSASLVGRAGVVAAGFRKVANSFASAVELITSSIGFGGRPNPVRRVLFSSDKLEKSR